MRLDCKRQKQIDLRAEQATATAARLLLSHTMDVRFYPSAGGNSIPGEPPNLDFAHCLGYYNFNKVKRKRALLFSAVVSVLCEHVAGAAVTPGSSSFNGRKSVRNEVALKLITC